MWNTIPRCQADSLTKTPPVTGKTPLAINHKSPSTMSNYLDKYFQAQSGILVGKIPQTSRVRGRISPLIRKEQLPSGQGFNWSNVIYERSISSGGAGWVSVATPDGTANNCTPSPATLNPASNVRTFSASQKLIQSNKICFVDASAGYLFEQQVAAIEKNFVDEVADNWEERDTISFIVNAKHKMILNSSMSENDNSSETGWPTTAPTSRLTQDFLDVLYTDLSQDGAEEDGAVGMSNGKAVYPIIMSQEQSANVIGKDSTMRQIFEYAEMGMGKNATLLKSWGVDKELRGWAHIINNKMPRYDLVGGVWTRRSFYSTSAANIGNQAEVSALYRNAAYELVIVWHPDVAVRMTPKPIGSVGGMTSGDAVNYNGDIIWKNIPNADASSDEYNPLSNQGRYYAPLMAAYKAEKPRYGYAILVQRCTGPGTLNPCAD